MSAVREKVMNEDFEKLWNGNPSQELKSDGKNNHCFRRNPIARRLFAAGEKAVLKRMGFFYCSEKMPETLNRCLVLFSGTPCLSGHRLCGCFPAIRFPDRWLIPGHGFIEDSEKRVLAWTLIPEDLGILLFDRPSPSFCHTGLNKGCFSHSFCHTGAPDEGFSHHLF